MRRSEDDRVGTAAGLDWRSWLALGWVVVFGLLYARMVVRERAPGAWEAVVAAGRAIRAMATADG